MKIWRDWPVGAKAMIEDTGSKIVRTTAEVSRNTIRLTEGTIKKAWSILDAASEKKTASEILSQRAIQAIQGKVGGG
jgi:hypothetical protein